MTFPKLLDFKDSKLTCHFAEVYFFYGWRIRSTQNLAISMTHAIRVRFVLSMAVCRPVLHNKESYLWTMG